MQRFTILGNLSEADSGTGRYPVKVIQPGWGSSGYYSEDLLQATAPMFEGAQMYWNHPKSSDDWERPERDLRDLAGVLTNVRYEAEAAQGAGIYGEATVFQPFRETLDEIAPYIGVSIRAGGKGHQGEAEGRSGLLIDEINMVQSVDFVTRAGAGGKVLARFAEAARPPEPEGESMELKEAMETIAKRDESIASLSKSLQEARADAKDKDEKIAALTQQVARMNEAAMLAECKSVVSAELKEAELPEVTKERILGDAARYMAVKESDDGKSLDADKVKASVQEAVKAEAEYIGKLSGGINVTGMGGKPEKADVDGELEESLKGLFESMGMTEKAAENAAKGR